MTNAKQIPVRQLVFTFAVPLAVLLAMAVVHVLTGNSITRMTRDMAVIAKVHPLSGFLSNLGVLLWCASATVCLFACAALHRLGNIPLFRFFLASGLLSAYLLMDDFFMVHEFLGPRYLGLPEKAIIALLGVSVLVYLAIFRAVILGQTPWLFLLLALGFLGTSAFSDVFFYRLLESRIGYNWAFFIEDGAKWLGIASWCSYFVRTAYQALVPGWQVPRQDSH